MNNYFVILAAGKGSRFSNKKPKQYHLYKNKELYEHSINKSISSLIASPRYLFPLPDIIAMEFMTDGTKGKIDKQFFSPPNSDFVFFEHTIYRRGS